MGVELHDKLSKQKYNTTWVWDPPPTPPTPFVHLQCAQQCIQLGHIAQTSLCLPKA